jgi:hypothetical protein
MLYTNLCKSLIWLGFRCDRADRLGERGREYPLILAGGLALSTASQSPTFSMP